jgi:hypothetical protein
MTGSGKTGLCLAAIEEAAIDGVPVIAIDRRGHRQPALDVPEAGAGGLPALGRPRRGAPQRHHAGRLAATEAGRCVMAWRRGARTAHGSRLRNAADFTIYTPGSKTGVPVSILSSCRAAGSARRPEALGERAGSTALSVLSLAGVEVAARSREHTLLSTILATAWRAGRDSISPP